MMKNLSILIIGVGAIGTYIGVNLANFGSKVVYMGRSESINHLNANRFILRDKETTIIQENPVIFSSLEQALESENYDLVILAIKAYHVDSFLAQLDSFLSRNPSYMYPPILCLQNGVDSEALISKHLSSDQVIAGTVTTSVRRIRLGDVEVEKNRGIGIASGHKISVGLVDEIRKSGINARLYESPQEMKWSKLITNLISNASSAILGMNPDEVFSNKKLYEIEIGQVREALAVMRSLRIKPANLPSTSVKQLVWVITKLPLSASQFILKPFLGKGRGGKMPSLYIDFQSGNKFSEVEYLNGAVSRWGKKTNTPTPINDILTATLLKLISGEYNREEFDHKPDRLLEEFQNL